MPLSDEEARDIAVDFVMDWATEARNDKLGVIEAHDLSDEDADRVMYWVDRAEAGVTFRGV